MLLQKLHKQNLINCPSWLPNNTVYLCEMGSIAYATNNDVSDVDIYGICIPRKDNIFPNIAGYIQGFGDPPDIFTSWQEHHIKNEDKEYDLNVFGIVKYFQLLLNCSPNITDSIFVPRRCVLHTTKIGEKIKHNRKAFLSKKNYITNKGYSFNQISKIKGKQGSLNIKRKKTIEEFGYDLKYACHAVRLLLQSEQILEEGDLDLERNSDILKSIRNGEWELDYLYEWVNKKEKDLEAKYDKSKIQNTPDEKFLKDLLLECLTIHYGTLDDVLPKIDRTNEIINDIEKILNKWK